MSFELPQPNLSGKSWIAYEKRHPFTVNSVKFGGCYGTAFVATGGALAEIPLPAYSVPEQERTFKNLRELPELEKCVKYESLTVLSEKEVI